MIFDRPIASGVLTGLLVLGILGVVASGCDVLGGDSDASSPPEPSFSIDVGAPINQTFSGSKAYQATLPIEGGRYAQLFVAVSGDDTTAFFLGYGAQRSTALGTGTYDIVDYEDYESREGFDGFLADLQSEQIPGLGHSLDGTVTIDSQSDGVAKGSFSETAALSVVTPDSLRTETVEITGSFTAKSQQTAVSDFLPIDRVLEVDSTDL